MHCFRWMAFWRWAFGFVAFLWCCQPVHARGNEAREKLCIELLQGKRLLASAQCYIQLARGLSAAGLKKDENRYQKGRWLRNVTIIFSRVARAEKDFEKRGYYYERAKVYALVYLRQRLYETKHQRRLATVRLAGLDAKIGYVSLSVVTRHLKARIQLEGYQFRAVGVGTWSKRVRRGNYVVKVTYPGKPVEIKTIKINSSEPKVLSFSVPVLRKVPERRRLASVTKRRPVPRSASAVRRSTWPWVLMVAGGAVVVAGAVFAGLGGANFAAANTMRERGLNGTATDTDTVAAYDALHEQVAWQVPVGGALLGVGVTVAVVGFIGSMLHKTGKPTPSAQLIRPRTGVVAFSDVRLD